MLRRTLFFAQPHNLRLRNLQLLYEHGSDSTIKGSIPIEDIGTIILEDQQTTITLPLIAQLAENNVSVVVCDAKRLPCAIVMPLNANTTQAETIRQQANVSVITKKRLWKQIIESKIQNQALLLTKYGLGGEYLRPYYSNVKSGDTDNREGTAARIYWKRLFGSQFIRNRDAEGINSLLNYGYAILRTCVARSLLGSGLLPNLGIFHRNKYNAFPLADDIMEPYRPFVDEIVYTLALNGRFTLDKETKSTLIGVMYCDTHFGDMTRPLQVGTTFTTSSLADIISGETRQLSLPKIR